MGDLAGAQQFVVERDREGDAGQDLLERGAPANRSGSSDLTPASRLPGRGRLVPWGNVTTRRPDDRCRQCRGSSASLQEAIDYPALHNGYRSLRLLLGVIAKHMRQHLGIEDAARR